MTGGIAFDPLFNVGGPVANVVGIGNPNRDTPFLQGVAVIRCDEHGTGAAMLSQDGFDFV